jgi:hypothetical protein
LNQLFELRRIFLHDLFGFLKTAQSYQLKHERKQKREAWITAKVLPAGK